MLDYGDLTKTGAKLETLECYRAKETVCSPDESGKAACYQEIKRLAVFDGGNSSFVLDHGTKDKVDRTSLSFKGHVDAGGHVVGNVTREDMVKLLSIGIEYGVKAPPPEVLGAADAAKVGRAVDALKRQENKVPCNNLYMP